MKKLLYPLLLVAGLWTHTLLAEWPQFRGPGGQGHSNAKGLPTVWSETENLTWKVPIPGTGLSSPVISGDQIWMTTAGEEGRSLRAICVHRASGLLIRDVELFRLSEAGPHHAKNSFATPTPVLEDGRIYVHFGNKGTACLSSDGKVLWKTSELDYDQPYAGASSPVLFEDLLILTCDGTDRQFIAALHKRTGRVVWKTSRQHLEDALVKDRAATEPRRGWAFMSYSTPLVIDVDGVPQLVSPAAEHVAAYDARTGKEIWWHEYDHFSQVTRPIYTHGLVFVTTSEDMLYAIRPETHGKVTGTQLAWELNRGAPHVPSLLVVGDELYLFNDRGVATCMDARTGHVHWKKRIGGNYSASPIYADGRIYVCSEEGKVSLLAPGKEFKLLGTNHLDGEILASPAVAGQALFLRTLTHLYRIDHND